MALASARGRSAAATSGRRSSNCAGTPTGIGGRAVRISFTGEEKIRGQLAEENSDGMFVLCARDAQIDGRSLYTLERRSGLNDGNVVVDASVIEPLRQIESLLISGHGVVENLLQSILTADLEIVLGETNLLRPALDFEIGGADLRTVLVFAHLVADLAPEVGRPGHINRERHERADSPRIDLRRRGYGTRAF